MKLPSTIISLLKWGEEMLSASDIDSFRIDAKLLLTSILPIDEITVYRCPDLTVSPEAVLAYRGAIERRSRREPVAYILGQKEFWKHSLSLNEETLIPRPETEILVETTLSYISSIAGDRTLHLLDIGTGSGNIPISLTTEVDSLFCTAIDISYKALEAAKINSEANKIGERINCLNANLFDLPFSNLDNGGLFDIIVSNPPYIRSSDIGSLMPEVSIYEPRRALDGGEDGLNFYRVIIEQSHSLLCPKGLLVMEIGLGQAEDIIGFIKGIGIFGEVEVIKDLAGIERVVAANRQD